MKVIWDSLLSPHLGGRWVWRIFFSWWDHDEIRKRGFSLGAGDVRQLLLDPGFFSAPTHSTPRNSRVALGGELAGYEKEGALP